MSFSPGSSVPSPASAAGTSSFANEAGSLVGSSKTSVLQAKVNYQGLQSEGLYPENLSQAGSPSFQSFLTEGADSLLKDWLSSSPVSVITVPVQTPSSAKAKKKPDSVKSVSSKTQLSSAIETTSDSKPVEASLLQGQNLLGTCWNLTWQQLEKEDQQSLENAFAGSDNLMKSIPLLQAMPWLQPSAPLQASTSVQESSGGGGASIDPMAFSEKFQKLLQEAAKNGRNIRVALDDSASVILRIRRGKVSAEFVATHPEAARWLQSRLEDLKQRMASQDLPVEELTFREEHQRRKQSSQQPPDEKPQKAPPNPEETD